MVEAIAKAAKDEEWKQRVEAALDSDKNLRSGDESKKVFGLPKLGELIGIEIANTAAEWLGYRHHTEEDGRRAQNPPQSIPTTRLARADAAAKWTVASSRSPPGDPPQKDCAVAARYLGPDAGAP